ncbi:MAG TPA: uracil-DNA glycosylase family protein [Kofleriaceae bacterium]|nr:uracil-DNA glycosylase family protein [Kofleriaceae bacterium]
MLRSFDPGYVAEPFLSLCGDYPGEAVYSPADFRVEWGPIFHRGRLDGSARILLIGQDPAAHEAIARRILVGEAGQRAQGFLAKLGITTSYVAINTFLYSVYGSGSRHKNDPAIIAYRNRWLDALLVGSQVEAVVALGSLAHDAFQKWKLTAAGKAVELAYEHIFHPTYPQSAGGNDAKQRAELTRQMLANWNAALGRLSKNIQHPDVVQPLVPYGDAFTPGDLAGIPAQDLPAGLPAWMRSIESWAVRKGDTPEDKRATLVVTVPQDARWHVEASANVLPLRAVQGGRS